MPLSIAYHQPFTRGGVADILGSDVSRDVIGALRDKDMITAGPRSPTPGAPFTYVTTKSFLKHFGLDTLRDLPDLEALEDAGLLDASSSAATFASLVDRAEDDPHNQNEFDDQGPPND